MAYEVNIKISSFYCLYFHLFMNLDRSQIDFIDILAAEQQARLFNSQPASVPVEPPAEVPERGAVGGAEATTTDGRTVPAGVLKDTSTTSMYNNTSKVMVAI